MCTQASHTLNFYYNFIDKHKNTIGDIIYPTVTFYDNSNLSICSSYQNHSGFRAKFLFKNKFINTKNEFLNNNMYNLSMSYQNFRGHRSKLFNLHSNFILLSYNIFFLIEIWLSEDISNVELVLKFSNYTIFRYDRNIHSSNLSRGDGVLIAVKDTLRPQIFPNNIRNVEQLCIRISVSNVLSALISVV